MDLPDWFIDLLVRVAAGLLVIILTWLFSRVIRPYLPAGMRKAVEWVSEKIRLVTTHRWFWPSISISLITILAFFAICERYPLLCPFSNNNLVEITPLCRLEENFVVDLVAGPAAAEELVDIFRIANPRLIEHFDQVTRELLNGTEHKGITYVWGSPGVGKSFIARSHLHEGFPGTSCYISLSDLFGEGLAGKRQFAVSLRPNLSTLSGDRSYDSLPAIAQPGEFSFAGLFAEPACMQNGEPVDYPGINEVDLIVVDDIDEIHSEASNQVLQALDDYIEEFDTSEGESIHIAVFGRSEGFATWFLDPKRHEDIVDFLRVDNLEGPLYRTIGDLEVMGKNQGVFRYGVERWEEMVQDGRAGVFIENFVDYVLSKPLVTYSIRRLAIATMVFDRAPTDLDDTQAETQAYLFEELLFRAARVHDRPLPVDENFDEYLFLLEEIAERYLDRVDAEGFFHVGPSDAVQVSARGEAQVLVQEALNHSGLAVVDLPVSANARYRFDPFWVHAYLVELRNQRSNPAHEIRTCQE